MAQAIFDMPPPFPGSLQLLPWVEGIVAWTFRRQMRQGPANGGPSDADCSRALALVRLRIEGLRLGEIGVRVLQELCFGLLVAEGLALDVGIYLAVGLHLFAVGKALGAHIFEFAGYRERGRGESKHKCASERRRYQRPLLGSSPMGFPPTWAANKTRGRGRPFPIPRPPQ